MKNGVQGWTFTWREKREHEPHLQLRKQELTENLSDISFLHSALALRHRTTIITAVPSPASHVGKPALCSKHNLMTGSL